VEAEVAFFHPSGHPVVEIKKILDLHLPQRDFYVPDQTLDAALLVGPRDVTGVDRKSVMPGKIQERRVVLDLGGSPDDDTLEVVIAMPMGDTPDLMEGPDMALQEELLRLTGIETDDGIPRPGQDINEAVDRCAAHLPFHPIDLGFLVMLSST
jgi:hypothetical protein